MNILDKQFSPMICLKKILIFDKKTTENPKIHRHNVNGIRLMHFFHAMMMRLRETLIGYSDSVTFVILCDNDVMIDDRFK